MDRHVNIRPDLTVVVITLYRLVSVRLRICQTVAVSYRFPADGYFADAREDHPWHNDVRTGLFYP